MTSITADGTIYIRDNSGIQYSTDNANWTSITSWPITINKLSTGVIVNFTTDLTLSGGTRYFICGTSDITFGLSTGQATNITISGITNYLGLIKNGTSLANGYNNITVQNLNVLSSSSSLAHDAGWVCQQYFCKSATNNLVRGCSSNGNLTGLGQGGIVGNQSCRTGGSMIVEYCYSTGSIGAYGGGIMGSQSASNTGSSLLVRKCYSTGTINQEAGGIFGDLTANGLNSTGGICTAEDCFSLGEIGRYAGGIFGSGASNRNTISGKGCFAIRCYSRGALSSQESGGIYGFYAGFNSGYTNATNCYSFGSITGFNAGGIYGSSAGTNTTTTNCYIANGAWNKTNADASLTGEPASGQYIGTSWATTDPSSTTTPYILTQLGYSPYTYDLQTSYSQTVSVGTSSNGAVRSGYGSYQILDSSPTYGGSINSSTGAISTTSASSNAYSITVYNQNTSNSNIYSISTFNLTVTPRILTTISLTPLSVYEGVQYSGILSSDSSEPTAYSIIAQPYDNLYVSGNQLLSRYPFNYQLDKTFPITIRGISNGTILDKQFTIVINDVPQPPTAISLSNNTIPEDAQPNSKVGMLLTVDPDPTDIHRYQFVVGPGDEDNSLFTILSSELYTGSNTTFNYRQKSTYSIRVRSTDFYGNYVESILKVFVILPIANDMNISALVGTTKRIVLNGTPISAQPLVYTILSQPQYGTLTQISNGVYDYLPTDNKIDSFTYQVQEGTMTSLPGTVTIYNYSQQDIANIPKQQGTWLFDKITFDGTTWTFGTMQSTNFQQFIQYNIYGNYTFYLQSPPQ